MRNVISVCFVWGVILGCSRLAVSADVEAVVGEPFGVAAVTLTYPQSDLRLPIGKTAVRVQGPPGRVHYPAVSHSSIRRLLSGTIRRNVKLEVLFLFRGDTPFDVTVSSPSRQAVSIVPREKSQLAHRRLMRRWWDDYQEAFRDLGDESEHPPVIETYLTSMLARRLGFDEPLLDRLASETRDDKGSQALELLAAAPAARMRLVRAASLGALPAATTLERPLPAPINWQTEALPELTGDVEIEPLAMRVPQECFYVRFGEYANFLWFNALLEEYGGELGNMIAARGSRTGLSERIQGQLAMRQGALAEILGPQAIADVAAIGLDTFVLEGAAIGAIFEARGKLLGIDLTRQRQEALFREKSRGATLTTIQIAGHDVSFLSTPDNRLRSYYAVDGRYHLVTNSRTIVERFFEVASRGNGSLGANEEFRHARAAVPASRDDTIFIYFSSAFFQNLLSPHYQIELYRRLRAATDLELILLAQLAAQAEGLSVDSLQDLIASRLLPDQFGHRADQSSPAAGGTGIVDSLRGARGYFLPVPDVPVSGISPIEEDRYLKHAAYHAEHWQQFDPILVAVKRYALAENRIERVTFDAYFTPTDDFKLRVLMSLLGEPSPYKLVPPRDCIATIDASVRGGTVFKSVPPHRLFLGLLDREPLGTSRSDKVLNFLNIIGNAPGYLGAWPTPGFLDMIPLLSRAAAREGFSQLPLGVLRWQGRDFSVLAMDESILTSASEELGFVEESRTAHVRAIIGDLSKAKFAGWLNQMGFERARQASVASARYMSMLSQQLKLPAEQARTMAERLLNAQLVCALGGEFELVDHYGEQFWQSTAWPDSTNYSVPDDYVSPPLDWFRGLEVRLLKHPGRLVVHGYVDMQRRDTDSGIKLPLFDLFGAKSNQGDDEEKASKPSGAIDY